MKQILIIRILLLTAIIFSGKIIYAQNISISNNPSHTADPSAVLDVQSTDRGILTPRLSRAQRDSITTPANGLLIYQTDEQSGFYFFDNTEWKSIGGQSSALSSNIQVGQQDENTPIPEHIWDPINGSASYDTSGIIYDSGGAGGNYFDNQDSDHRIFPPNWPEMDPQLGIQIEIISLNVHESDSLLIVVYDGTKSYSNWYKGNLSNIKLPFGSERALLRFISDGTLSDSGFEIRYDWIYPPSDTTGGTTENLGWFYEPAKMAMRGGIDFVNGWHLDSIGQGSFSFGENVKAVGNKSMAMGQDSRAKGDHAISLGMESHADGNLSFAAAGGEADGSVSIAIGKDARASNTRSVAIGGGYSNGYESVSLGGGAIGSYALSAGQNTRANGRNSIALGFLSSSDGDYSISAGYRNEAQASYQTTFGRYSREYNSAHPADWIDSDPLFVIGDGSAYNQRSNALTLLKNGNLGLGYHLPQFPLHIVSGNVTNGTQTMAYFKADSTDKMDIVMRPSSGNNFKIICDGDASTMQFTSTSHLMTLDWDDNGRVGIGTTSPQSRLHVEGTLEIDNTIKANDSEGISFTTENDVEVMRMVNSGFSLFNERLFALNDEGLSFSTNDNLKRLTIADDGNVGIGPATTDSKLFVNGRLEVQNEIKANGNLGIRFLSDDNNIRMTVADNGNIGIGTTSPTSSLHIEGALEIDDQIKADDASGLNLASDDGTTRLHVNDNGRIGIGTTNPDAQLAVIASGSNDALRVRIPTGTRLRIFNNGHARIGQNGGAGSAQLNINALPNIDPLIVQEDGDTHFMVHDNGGVSVGTSTAPSTNGIRVNGSYAAKSGGGSWTATSDIRLKKVHENFDDGLASVLKIRPVRYSYNEKSGYETNENHIGVVAQELEEIAPYMIGQLNQDGEEYLTVDNSAMVYMLINAVKEQQAMITELQTEIRRLKKEKP